MSIDLMGGPTPQEMGIKKTSEHNREEIKKQITEKIRGKLGYINVGSYTADKDYDGGYGEDLFDEPENLDEILNEIKSKIDLSVAENWTRERFIQELSQMKLNFNFSAYKNFDDFSAFRNEGEPLDAFINIEEIANMLYNE